MQDQFTPISVIEVVAPSLVWGITLISILSWTGRYVTIVN